MKIKLMNAVLLLAAAVILAFTGCGSPSSETVSNTSSVLSSSIASGVSDTKLADGVYSVEFITDSSMFHVNEANDGKGVLTVENGKMTIHVSLASKSILNLFYGTAEAAQQEGASLLEPTTDKVTYSDGTTEEVNGFDIPVPSIGEEFAVALVGTKGNWYDHMVSVSNPVPVQ